MLTACMADMVHNFNAAAVFAHAALLCTQGEQLLDRLYIPRLRVRKNWYVGLNPDPVDHSHPDIGKAEGAENPFDHAAHAAQAAHKAAAAHATPSHAGHAAAGHAPQHPHSPPPPPQQQQQQPPVKPANIPTQPLPQGQQHPQQQAGGQAPSLPQSPPPPVVQQQPPHPPAQQQGTAQQATQQQGTAQQAAATPQAATTQQAANQQPAQEPPKDMSAVLKVKERIDNYAKQFGQVSSRRYVNLLFQRAAQMQLTSLGLQVQAMVVAVYAYVPCMQHWICGLPSVV
jgi:hypothetical protein